MTNASHCAAHFVTNPRVNSTDHQLLVGLTFGAKDLLKTIRVLRRAKMNI
ncbi:predicted protein [Sclerotinia sclerotiorum 1980 UF-70]|uniref:Uncharacterized protein n=1 Tax=Sclerotinia sclerotiorum (strain ATCC 18683 / 1980 / Ss-1) TaxID=665079 RepID=A7F6J1_SCLS1|nr:predicted protein [Sclerotinia sclerotiorum 1980 UF-70]EDN98362.1 predicted protein [Sclerotinia sclerotiorum 1980 UF-70]